MPGDYPIEVEGIDDVIAMLGQTEHLVETTALVTGLNVVGEFSAQAIEDATPVKDENVPTSEYSRRIAGGNSLDKGLLKASVKFEIIVDSRNRGGYVEISHGRYSYVANYLEYGHRLVTHGIKAIRRVIGFVKPYPFIRPTAERVAEESIYKFYDTVREVLISQGYADEEDIQEVA